MLRTSRRRALVAAVAIAFSLHGCSNDEDASPQIDLGSTRDAAVPDGSGLDAVADTLPDAGIGRFDPQVEQTLQQMLQDWHTRNGPPGAVLAAQLDQTKRWAAAVGKSDLAAGTSMEVDQLFRIASITKVFVATLVLLLEEDNKLSIEDTLDEFVSTSVVPNGDEILLYRLMNHTSGIANCNNAPGFWDEHKVHTPLELVQMAVDLGPSFAPGEEGRWEYSNTNYVLLGLIIEQVTEKNFHEVLRERILQPYDLNRTFVEDYESIDDPEVKGHRLVDDQLQDVTNAYPLVSWTAGGMVSTATDLTRFFALLHAGSILSAASLKKMREQHNVDVPQPWDLPPEVTSYRYGLGLATIVVGDDTYHGHTGNTNGFHSMLGYRVRDRINVAAFANAQETPALALGLSAYSPF